MAHTAPILYGSNIASLQPPMMMDDHGLVSWNPLTLKKILQRDLSGDEVLIVSNREPYLHVKVGGQIEVRVPASGLVTALEPIMRACSGTWIAHGSGSGDREVVDRFDRIAVPPENPSYHIRRVWLTPEEEQGYYYGFSNEGLWPLCHVAHVRPIFRSADWHTYVDVNRKFAQAVVEEAKTEDPVILVQDYHYALLPKFIRELLPNATIITFWHIPWPNAEVFGICPWRSEILEGLLGSDILGFHTRFHCNNFLYTVDQYLESRIFRDTSMISHGGQLTAVEDYPISIEWPSRWVAKQAPISECREKVFRRHHLADDHKIGVGVDRLDYTKGIVERFLAIERMLELHPQWRGKFSFVQIAAPSRTVIERYRLFQLEVKALADRINETYGNSHYRPIILKLEHHEPPQVYEYFRASDVCMVTSLHDGMNLVAKEFIAAREDSQGVLILSQFAGAAKEMPEALIVNPYNIDQCATALHIGLTMPRSEQNERMKGMRVFLEGHNVYQWAGRMLMAAARVRKRKRLIVHKEMSG